MKTTRRPTLAATQLAYAAAKAVHDLAFDAYMASDDEDGDVVSDKERALYAAWMAAKADLRIAERAMVAEMTAKLKRNRLAAAHIGDIDYVVANATGEHWNRVVDLCFRAA